MKTIVLTGASSGFGKLLVPILLHRGHRIIAAVRGGKARLEKIFPHESKQYGDRLVGIHIEMEKKDTFDATVDLIENKFDGRLDVLINNAGLGFFGAIEDMPEQAVRDQFEINFFGPLILTQKLLPFLHKTRGRILNVSSIAGLATFPFYGVYAASKHALEAASESLYYELKPFGIQVGLIEPGGFRTEFMSTTKKVALPWYQQNTRHTQRFKRLFETMDQMDGRLGDPVVVARKMANLCEARVVPVRTTIGKDAWLELILLRMLPDSWRIRIHDFFYRKFVYGD